MGKEGLEAFSRFPSEAARYISRGHAKECQGRAGPGPAAYKVRGNHETGSESPAFSFARRSGKSMADFVPGQASPGPAYVSELDKSGDTLFHHGAHSFGSCPRPDLDFGANKTNPSPLEYKSPSGFAKQIDSRHPTSPIVSFGVGERSTTANNASGVGPKYMPKTLKDGRGEHDSPKFSFGSAERTPTNGRAAFTAPGPGQYVVKAGDGYSKKQQAPQFSFSSADREREKGRYVSRQHCQDLVGRDNPGPGQYSPKSDFGKGGHTFFHRPTLPISHDFQEPGPGSYSQTSSVTQKSIPGCLFGSKNSSQKMNPEDHEDAYEEHGEDASVHSVSRAKPEASPGPKYMTTYDRFGKDSHKSNGVVFSQAQRMSQQKANVPGPGTYDQSGDKIRYKSGAKFSFGGSSKGSTARFISKLHVADNIGKSSPGPGAYTLPSSFGNLPKYSFGGGSSRTSGQRRSQAPGPEYRGKSAFGNQSASTKPSEPSFSFGSAQRENEKERYISKLHSKELIAKATPGPGTYDVKSIRDAPAYSLGGP